MADPGAVDAAVLEALRADVALMALCPGGVVYGLAPNGVQRFVLVDRFDHADDGNLFGLEPAGESFLFLVKAVLPGTESDIGRQAAAQIRLVLDGSLALAPAGYALLAPVAEVEALRMVEVDEQNPDRRVQHMGGQYAVLVQRIG